MVVNKSKSAFRSIAEVSEELGIAKYVLRFWETKFPQISPMKRNGRRYYRPDDVLLLKHIQNLLYVKRLTIEGAQKEMKNKSMKRLIGEAVQDDFFAVPADKDSPAAIAGELAEVRDELDKALKQK